MVIATGNYEDSVIEIGNKIATLQSSQCKDLLQYLKDQYDIEALESVSVVDNTIDTGDVIVEEPTSFDVLLKEVDIAKRVGVIKVIRTSTGLGLMEAKAILDGLPKVLKEALSKEDAEKLKKELEAAGGKVELK